MWLINTATLQLEESMGEPPRYAILSHRWRAGQELTFGDIVTADQNLSGCQKVQRFCQRARRNDYTHAWADTCCIDKKSSAELSEAINSMYAWYRGADICYAYLGDVTSMEDFGDSSWWERGWTLQELLAPAEVLFFDQNWKPLGTKSCLSTTIERLTGISRHALGRSNHNDYCVAAKMSWAAHRKCTRTEDSAYCLLGLFNVNMPLLYGEGDKAFQRLQEEIMKVDNDMSLFWWQGRKNANIELLAHSPASFFNMEQQKGATTKNHGHVSSAVDRHSNFFRTGVSWTIDNIGIHMRNVTLYPFIMSYNEQHDIYALLLRDRGSIADAREDDVASPVVLLQRAADTVYRHVRPFGSADDYVMTRDDPRLVLTSMKFAEILILRISGPVGPWPATPSRLLGARMLELSLELTTGVDYQHFTPNKGDFRNQLEDWTLSNSGTVEDENTISLSLMIYPSDIRCLFDYILLTTTDKMYGTILVCFGLNASFTPMCFVAFFAKGLFEHSVTVTQIVASFARLNERPEGTIWGVQGGVFDESALAAALTGSTRSHLKSTDVAGISVTMDVEATPWRIELGYDEMALAAFLKSRAEEGSGQQDQESFNVGLRSARIAIGIRH